MKCEHCDKVIDKPIQEHKLDYWKCSTCGDYHKGYPYTCPYRLIVNKITETYDESSSYKDFKEWLFIELEQFWAFRGLYNKNK